MPDLTLVPDHRELRRLRPWLQSWLDPALDHQLGRVELCIHEMATNVVDHAEPTSLVITGRLTVDEVEVELRDDGRPYVDSTRAPHPRIGGYGLMIAEQLASAIVYARHDNENRWTIRFDRKHSGSDQNSPDSTSMSPASSIRSEFADTGAMALRSNRTTHPPAVLVASGRLDTVEAAPLRASINQTIGAGNNRIVVDLSAVEFIDSAGLAALVIGMKRARLEQGDLRLVSPREPDARRVFELTKFDDVFVMTDAIDQLLTEWNDD